MASKLVEQLLNGVAGTIALIAQEKLTELFAKLHAHDAEKHSSTLKSLYIGVGEVQKLTDESKTKLDDAVVDALKGAIEQSAAEFDVDLED